MDEVKLCMNECKKTNKQFFRERSRLAVKGRLEYTEKARPAQQPTDDCAMKICTGEWILYQLSSSRARSTCRCCHIKTILSTILLAAAGDATRLDLHDELEDFYGAAIRISSGQESLAFSVLLFETDKIFLRSQINANWCFASLESTKTAF